MPLLDAGDCVPARPRRVLVAGTSGSGKTTMARSISTVLGMPHVEIDVFFHGPGWTPRSDFQSDVQRFSAGPAWVTEWQYGSVRAHLAERADLLVWLDLPKRVVMRQVVVRTITRRVRHPRLWNGNVELTLWTILTDCEHIVRWAWTTDAKTAVRLHALLGQRARSRGRPTTQPLGGAPVVTGGAESVKKRPIVTIVGAGTCPNPVAAECRQRRDAEARAVPAQR